MGRVGGMDERGDSLSGTCCGEQSARAVQTLHCCFRCFAHQAIGERGIHFAQGAQGVAGNFDDASGRVGAHGGGVAIRLDQCRGAHDVARRKFVNVKFFARLGVAVIGDDVEMIEAALDQKVE